MFERLASEHVCCEWAISRGKCNC